MSSPFGLTLGWAWICSVFGLKEELQLQALQLQIRHNWSLLLSGCFILFHFELSVATQKLQITADNYRPLILSRIPGL